MSFFFSGWECWGTYLWVHIMIHGLLMGVEATRGEELDQMVDQLNSAINSSDPFAFVRATMNMFGDHILTGHAHHP